MTRIVRKHKELNTMPIKFEETRYISLFNEICIGFNKLKSNDIPNGISFDYSEVKRLLHTDNKSEFNEILKRFSDKTSGIFTIPEEPWVKIYGSIFTIMADDKNEIMNVWVNGPFTDYLFFQDEIDILAENKKDNPMISYEKGTKFNAFFIEDNDKTLKFKSKYDRRLYQILNQYINSGWYKVKIDEFIVMMGMPRSYRTTDLFSKILTPAKKNLIKVGIEITDIEKIKKGRKIETIKIKFKKVKVAEEAKVEEKKKPIVHDTNKLIDLIGSNYSIVDEMKELLGVADTNSYVSIDEFNRCLNELNSK